MKSINFEIFLLLFVLSNTLLSAKINSEKNKSITSVSNKNKHPLSGLKLNNFRTNILSHKLLDVNNNFRTNIFSHKLLDVKKMKYQTPNTFVTQTSRPSKREYALATLNFILEIVAALKIPVISEMAQKIIKVKQMGQACMDGIQFFVDLIQGFNKGDSEYITQKEAIKENYKEFLVEVKQTYIFFHGKNFNYEQILNSSSVEQICFENYKKAKRADPLKSLEENVLRYMNQKSTFAFIIRNSKPGEGLKNIEVYKNNLAENAKKIDEELKKTPEEKKAESRDEVNNLKLQVENSSLSDLGNYVCDFSKDDFNHFNRFICYTYFDQAYFDLLTSEKKTKSEEIIKEIHSKFDTLYDKSVIEAERRQKIVDEMDCELAKPVEEQKDLTKILTIVSKFIDVLKSGRSFINDCLTPAYELANEFVEEIKAKKQEKIDAEIKRAEEEAQKIKILNPEEPEKLLVTIPLSEEVDLQRVKEEVEFYRIFIEQQKRYLMISAEKKNREELNNGIEQQIKSFTFSDDFMNEDVYCNLSQYNPSEEAKKFMEKTKENAKKVGDMAKHVGETFVDEAKKEAKRMYEAELEEFKENPIKYQKKVVKESAKFLASPQKYVGQTVVEFGVRTTVNTAYTLGHEVKDSIVTEKFREERPYASFAIDKTFDLIDENKEKLQEYAQGKVSKAKYISKLYADKKLRFKEISKRRIKMLSKSRRNNRLMNESKKKVEEFKMRVELYMKNKMRGYISNRFTEFYFQEGLKENQQLALDIGKKVAAEFMPYVKKALCGVIVNFITDMFGPGAFKHLLKLKQIYEIVRTVYHGYYEKDIVQKWTNYGKAIGKGIQLFIDEDKNKSICGRKKLKKFFKRR